MTSVQHCSILDTTKSDAPKGIRTPAPGLKGLCPGPLDDGGVFSDETYCNRGRASAQKAGLSLYRAGLGQPADAAGHRRPPCRLHLLRPDLRRRSYRAEGRGRTAPGRPLRRRGCPTRGRSPGVRPIRGQAPRWRPAARHGRLRRAVPSPLGCPLRLTRWQPQTGAAPGRRPIPAGA